MYRKPGYLALMLTGLLIALACSGSGGSPVLPNTAGNNSPGLTTVQSTSDSLASTKALWGYWEIVIDPVTWEVEIVPLRGPQYTVDVVRFLQPPYGSLSNLQIVVTDMTDWLSEGYISVDVGLTHPFPGLDNFTGFDVYGVFVTSGSVSGNYDGNVVYSDGENDPILLNSDGYTRWMNPVEFNGGANIFNFEPGALGNKNISLFTATINGYKYFADNLEKDQDVADYYSDPYYVDQRGMFKPGSNNRREYDLKFPIVGGVPSLIFQYAVIASWVPPDTSLSGDPGVLDLPGDFAPEANADEAFYIYVTDNSTLWNDGSGYGGNLNLELEVFDWGAYGGPTTVADEIYQIVVEGDPGVIPGGYATFDQSTLAASAMPGSSAISSVFEVEIADCTPTSNDPVPVLITIESSDPTTFDPGNGVTPNDDRLAGYFMHSIPVLPESPSTIVVTTPNGGETLWMAMSYEITWETGSGGISNVKIEWSTDDFGSDIRTIVDDTENDGSYEWKPIPVEETDTGKVRISALGGAPDVDASDDYFSIALPVWLEFQTEYHVPYASNGYEFSPAIAQTTSGLVYVMFYGWLQGGSGTNDACAYSSTGTSWGVTNNYFGSGSGPGAPNYRADSAKIAPGNSGLAWVAICFSFNVGTGYLWGAEATQGGLGHYTFDGFNPNYNAGEFIEFATDSAGYVYMFSQNGTGTTMYWRKSNQPGFIYYGAGGQMGSVQMLSSGAIISHSRSWARQGQGLALIFYTPSGNMMLAETTDPPTNSTWDATETVWTGTGYTTVRDPALCADSTGRLFAVWTARETASGSNQILASMRETSGGSWTAPVLVTSSTADTYDDIHISSAVVSLPGGVSEDVAVVGWENSDKCSAALSPMDLMAFLPLQDVSLTGVQIMDPDVMCPGMSYVYDVLFAWSWNNAGNQDIALRNADFKIP